MAVPVSVAPGCAVDGPERGVSGWLVGFDDMFARVAGRFGRVEPRRAARDLLWGLLSVVERKNSWTLAEQAGHERPDAMQRLLRTACWDAGEVRDDLRAYVVEHLGHPDGVLIPDETGDLKKGSDSVGVQRQYTGTAGRIENAQVAVYLTYASPRGRALIDRRLYLPRCWTEDRTRCQRAGVPDEVIFATKPELAAEMVVDALDAGVIAPWVAADEVYGANPGFRAALESRGVGYVLAVACDQRVRTDAWTERADSLAARLPKRSWQRYSAGAGSKGPRLYDWAWIALSSDAGEHRSLLVRRGSDGELAYYLCWASGPVTLATLVRVAGTRWAVEESFQAGKTHVGLDEHQVRRWTSWHRFTTLAMLALAYLCVCTAQAAPPPDSRPGPPRHTNEHSELIDLTTGEIRHLLSALVLQPTHPPTFVWLWSHWRRLHQARARRSHYKRRLAIEYD